MVRIVKSRWRIERCYEDLGRVGQVVENI